MSNRELWHPQVMGQIMLLSLVTAHDLSISIPLAGRRTLLGEVYHCGLACVVPGSCEFVVSIFLVGSADYPFPFLRSFLCPPGWGGAHFHLLESRDDLPPLFK